MKRNHASPLFWALALAVVTTWGPAQAADPAAAVSPTRAQVRMETKDFLKTHRWDESNDTWVLKSGVEPPTGVMSRAVVKAQRDEFLRLNRWDEPTDTWKSRSPVPAQASTLTREQVRADTLAFTRSHHWSEETERWEKNLPLKK